MISMRAMIAIAIFLISINSLGQSLDIPKSGAALFPDSHLQQIVMNGDPVDENSPGAESLVKIRLKKGRSTSICTGVIVSHSYVMTAGHCFYKDPTEVEVQFSTLGATIQVSALDFRKVFPREIDDKPGVDFVNDYLDYNWHLSESFYSSIKMRRDWVNFPQFSSSMIDLALVRIETIPPGYAPLEFYTGKVSFGDQVVVAGFGVNSRHKDKNDFKARFAFHRLIGFVQPLNYQNLGWQTFSPIRQSACFGDSGGPLLKWSKERNKWEILGISTFGINKCANSSFANNANNESLRKLIKKWVIEMESSQSL